MPYGVHIPVPRISQVRTCMTVPLHRHVLTVIRYKTYLLSDETNGPKRRKAAKAYFQPAAGRHFFGPGPGPVSEHAVSELAFPPADF